MFQLLAWIAGLGLSIGLNAPYAAETTYVWWQGIVFGVLLFPGVWVLGFLLPRLSLNFASGAMIGGALSAVGALFTQNWSYLAGSMITAIVGWLTAHGQDKRVNG